MIHKYTTNISHCNSPVLPKAIVEENRKTIGHFIVIQLEKQYTLLVILSIITPCYLRARTFILEGNY